MPCARCGSDNLAGANFCSACGAPLTHRCSHCGADNLPQAKFCGECRAPRRLTITALPRMALRGVLHALRSVPVIGETAMKVLLPLALLLIVGTALVSELPWAWRSGGKSLTITSFTDTSGDKGGGFGHAIADALESEILRIAQLHTLKNPWGRSQDLPALQMTGPQTVQRVGESIDVSGIDFPLQAAMQALRLWVTGPKTQYVITGSLQRFPANGDESNAVTMPADCHTFPPGTGTRVQIIVRLEEDGRPLKRWSCKSRLSGGADSNADIRPDLASYLRGIAHEILWVTLEGIEANSLGNFKNLIEGVERFRQYKDLRRHDQELFFNAAAPLWRATQENTHYARAYFFLGNLYSWRAYYEADEYFQGLYEELAREQYERAGTEATANPPEAKALRHFGIGLVDYRRYLKAKARGSALTEQPYQTLEGARQAFTAAWEQDPTFYFARTGRALVYKEKAAFWNGVNDPQGEESCLNHALSEFQQARNTAAGLKDTDSVRWIEKQILELELQKRRGTDPSRSGTGLLGAFGGLFERSSACPDVPTLPPPFLPPIGDVALALSRQGQ
jgi:Double zinc ribbon